VLSTVLDGFPRREVLPADLGRVQTMRTRCLLTVAVLLVTAASRGGAGAKDAGDAGSQRDQAIKFLKAHVIGKTFKGQERTTKLDNGRMEAVFSATVAYSNLVETEDGFAFDETSVAKQTNYDLDKDGKRVLPGRNEDSAGAIRYEITRRQSTGKLVGFSRVLASTSKRTAPTGNAWAVRMEVGDGVLEMTESTLLYEDHYAEKGKFRPGATDARTRFSVTGGKAQGELVLTAFDVDPKTLKRTPKSDPPIKWIFTEER
jgi:hypothetical protein